MSKKVGILGTGAVGFTLANGFRSLGYDVKIGTRIVRQIEGWDGPVDGFENVADWADIVVLSVKGMVAETLVRNMPKELSGKTVIDTTNPIDEIMPEHGVLNYFTKMNESLMERLQRAAPGANFVKAFNSVGSNLMVNPKFGNTKPTMFICGNDDGAKNEVSKILNKFGWEAEDMGKVGSARPIESLCVLWCIPAIMGTSFYHAFKLLKK